MSAQPRKTFAKKLVAIVRLNLKLENTTGLLIQMPVAAQAYRIGGADKYPMVTRKKYEIGGSETELEVPYIPGSSFKGRMRALLELALGRKLYTTDGKIWSHVRNLSAMDFRDFKDDIEKREVVDELFGWASANYNQILDAAKKGESGTDPQYVADQLFSILSPTRLLVSDFFPTPDYVNGHNITSVADFLEEKPENRIDRITSAADPRDVVRVKPGVVFGGTLTLLLFDIDKNKVGEYADAVILGLKLLEETYLGGSGSRGYGRVRFVGEAVTVYKINPQGKDLLEKVAEIQFRGLDELVSKKSDLVNAIEKLY